MTTSTLSLAIIGLGGRISGVAANTITASGGRLRLIGYADPSPSGVQHLAACGIDAGRAFTDAATMLRELKPDAVMIGSPNHLHLEHIRTALAAGVRVFSEKPVVITPEETWQAAELLRQHGQERFLVGLVLRSSPLFRKVMAAIAVGVIGRPVSMEANEVLCPAHGGYIMRDWRRLRKYCGSHVLEKTCHDLDLHQAVLGARLVKVASFGGRNAFVPENAAAMESAAKADPNGGYIAWKTHWNGTGEASPFTSDGDILDNQVVAAEAENGARLTFHINSHTAWHQRRWFLAGTQGTLESDIATGTLKVQRMWGQAEQVDLGGGGGHYGADEAMAADLVATWFADKPFPVTTRAALEAGLAAMGIDQAQREARIVNLAPWWAKLDGILGAVQRAAAG